MNFDGLLSHQPKHAMQLCTALTKYGSALDASDTGTGKTYVALAICRHLNVVPFVLGTKNGRAEWERAAGRLGVDLEYVNYERVRGRRELRGGVEVDTLRVTQNLGVLFDTPVTVDGFRCGKRVFSKPCYESEATDYVIAGLRANGREENLPFLVDPGEYKFEKPFCLGQVRIAESDWIEEKKYGSGSFIKWKNNYLAMIFDEVHRCGGGTTLQSKLLIGARRQSKLVLALSATAADNPFQMKALGFALGLHKLNGPFGFRPWLLRHGCNYDDETKQISLSLNTKRQSEAFAKLHTEIFPAHGARMRKSEIPDFPHSKFEVVLLEPEGAAKKLTGGLVQLYKDLQANAKTSGLWISKMQELELLMIPQILERVDDLVAEMPVTIGVSYTRTRELLTEALQKKYGKDKIGWGDGMQTGEKGAAQRREFIDRFQRNELLAFVANTNALSESASLHDPTGKVERASIVTPQDSGRRLKQWLGRIDRAGGANSIQQLLYFAGTDQQATAERVELKLSNIDLLNDADLLFGRF